MNRQPRLTQRRRSELMLFGRVLECRGRALAGADQARHLVEVSGADEALMLDRRVAVSLEHLELAVLEPRVGAHALIAIAEGELEHAEVQGVEAGERHELEGVAAATELAL